MPRPLPVPRALSACALLACALVLAACATPLQPTGGPEDRTPPALETSAPAKGAVNVQAEAIVLTFSERVEEASLRRALQITPAPLTPPTVRLTGRTATITLAEGFRPFTTYVVTLGTDLRDTQGVALRAPVSFAFSTGPTIDRGRLAGRVREPVAGRGVGGLSVFAYALPAPDAPPPDLATAAPDYRTQTDPEGRFELGYLRPGPFFVVAGEDLARRGRPALAARLALPPAALVVPEAPPALADTLAEASPGLDPLGPALPRPPALPGADTLRAAPSLDLADVPTVDLFVALRDTLAPEARIVRPISDRRVAVRFSEAVLFENGPDAEAWTLTDSLAGAPVAGLAVYRVPSAPAEIVFEAPGPLAPRPHRIALVRAGAVRDSVGNAAAPFARTFTPPARPDPPAAGAAVFLPTARPDSVRLLRPDERPGVRFLTPPRERLARVAFVDDAGRTLAATPLTDDGLSYRFTFAQLPRGPFSLRVPLAAATPGAPDSVAVQRYRYYAADELGSLAGVVEGAAGGTVVVEAYPETGPPLVVRTSAAGAYVFDSLPPGAYRLRAFADLDGTGAWSPGGLAPFTPPEPLAFGAEPQRVRARWETEAPPLRFGD